MGQVKLKTITAPVEEPITTAQAKTHLRVTSSDDDTYIGLLITAARERIEEYLNRYVMVRTVEAAFDCAPEGDYLELPRCAPLCSLTWAKYYTEDGTATEFTSNLHTDSYAEPVRLVLEDGQIWPVVSELRRTNAIIVRYECGWDQSTDDATYDAVPEAIKHACKETVRWLYDGEEAASIEERNTGLPANVRAMVASYRLLEL